MHIYQPSSRQAILTHSLDIFTNVHLAKLKPHAVVKPGGIVLGELPPLTLQVRTPQPSEGFTQKWIKNLGNPAEGIIPHIMPDALFKL